MALRQAPPPMLPASTQSRWKGSMRSKWSSARRARQVTWRGSRLHSAEDEGRCTSAAEGGRRKSQAVCFSRPRRHARWSSSRLEYTPLSQRQAAERALAATAAPTSLTAVSSFWSLTLRSTSPAREASWGRVHSCA